MLLKSLVKSIAFTISLLFLCAPIRAEQAPLEIGVIVPLSGPLAEFGYAIKNGIELAQETTAAQASRVRFLFEDSQYRAQATLSAYRHLRNTRSVKVVFVFGSLPSAALAPIAEAEHVALFALDTEPATAAGRKFVVRFISRPEHFGRVLTDHLAQRGFKRIGIVLTENQYLRSMVQGLQDSLQPGQTLEVVTTVTPEETDFRTAVSRIRAGEYDAVGVLVLSGQIALLYRQLENQKVSFPTFGSDCFESTTEIESARGLMQNAVFANTAVSVEFRREYLTRYKNDLQINYAGLARDFAVLIADRIVGTALEGTSAEIINELARPEPVQGVTGMFQFEENDAGDRFFKFPVVLRQVNGVQARNYSPGAIPDNQMAQQDGESLSDRARLNLPRTGEGR